MGGDISSPTTERKVKVKELGSKKHRDFFVTIVITSVIKRS